MKANVQVTSELSEAHGYAAWIEQVWLNYLSNPIKYGGAPPQVYVSAHAKGKFIRYEVRGNGKGLTAEQSANVFKPFTRYASEKLEGHGVGLSICHKHP
ncbi:MAG: ATP-binding protein [Anaerolineae bacterium]|nr:ATP-binding protein [Anaerolineae bacterium]